MSLSRRVVLLLAAVLLLALAAGLSVQLLQARQALQAELAQRNRDGAALLALALRADAADPATAGGLLEQALAQGAWQRVQLWRPDGVGAVDLQAPAAEPDVPAWFVAALPLKPATGVAAVHDPQRRLGSVGVQARLGGAYASLWQAALHSLATLGLLGLAATILVAGVLWRWLAPVRDTVAQAQALEQGRFVEAAEPALPELRALTRSMNATVHRLRDVFAAQADQVQVLQRQAQFDAVTGLPLRRHFSGRLQAQLAEPGGPGAALILVRVLALDTLNHRLGHEATDRLLASAAGLLLAYVERVPGTFGGRLNGSDFALCLPIAGLAEETAQSLHAALVAAPALHAGGAQIVVGAVDGLVDTVAGEALAAADAALAQAEADGGLAVQQLGTLVGDPAGARAWREQLASALAEGRVRLEEFAVVGREGQLVHLECPLRVQLSAGGEYHAAARWLAMARRSRLLPQVDLAALELALAATAADGQPRAVHVALPSLSSPGFVADVAARLAQAPQAAALLSIEWVDDTAAPDWQGVADAAQRWRERGARLGVEHAGGQAQQLTALGPVAIDYVKVDARHLRGAAVDGAVRAYAQSLVTLIHGLGAQALAEGIDDAGDLDALWALGFDGATGPAVAALSRACAPDTGHGAFVQTA